VTHQVAELVLNKIKTKKATCAIAKSYPVKWCQLTHDETFVRKMILLSGKGLMINNKRTSE
jgi:hypothetical protein